MAAMKLRPDGTSEIESIYAVVASPEDDDEGVVGKYINGVLIPFIAADEDRLRDLLPHAVAMEKELGVTLMIATFSVKTMMSLEEATMMLAKGDLN